MTIATFSFEQTPGQREDVMLTVATSNGMALSGAITYADAIELICRNDDRNIIQGICRILSEIYEDDEEALALIGKIDIE